MNLKVSGMGRALLSRDRIQDLPEGMQEVHEQNGVKIAGFPGRSPKEHLPIINLEIYCYTGS